MQLIRHASPTRAISSAICPVDKRLGATFGFAISRQLGQLELEIRLRFLRPPRQPRPQLEELGFATGSGVGARKARNA